MGIIGDWIADITGHGGDKQVLANYDKVQVVSDDLRNIATVKVGDAQDAIYTAMNELNSVNGMAEYVGSVQITNYDAVFTSIGDTITSLGDQVDQKAADIKAYDESSFLEKAGATFAMVGAKLGEGILSVVEDLGDGVVSVVGWAAGKLGDKQFQSDCTNFINKEWSHDAFEGFYNSEFAKKSAITEDSAAAGAFKVVGTVAGYIGAGYLAAGAMGLSAAGTVGSGLLSASGVTWGGTVVAGISSMGSSMETSIRTAAINGEEFNYDKAFGKAVGDGAKSAVASFAIGKGVEKLSGALKAKFGANAADKMDEAAQTMNNADELGKGAEVAGDALNSADEAGKGAKVAGEALTNADEAGKGAKVAGDALNSADEAGKGAKVAGEALTNADEAGKGAKVAGEALTNADEAGKGAKVAGEALNSADEAGKGAKVAGDALNSADEAGKGAKVAGDALNSADEAGKGAKVAGDALNSADEAGKGAKVAGDALNSADEAGKGAKVAGDALNSADEAGKGAKVAGDALNSADEAGKGAKVAGDALNSADEAGKGAKVAGDALNNADEAAKSGNLLKRAATGIKQAPGKAWNAVKSTAQRSAQAIAANGLPQATVQGTAQAVTQTAGKTIIQGPTNAQYELQQQVNQNGLIDQAHNAGETTSGAIKTVPDQTPTPNPTPVNFDQSTVPINENPVGGTNPQGPQGSGSPSGGSPSGGGAPSTIATQPTTLPTTPTTVPTIPTTTPSQPTVPTIPTSPSTPSPRTIPTSPTTLPTTPRTVPTAPTTLPTTPTQPTGPGAHSGSGYGPGGAVGGDSSLAAAIGDNLEDLLDGPDKSIDEIIKGSKYGRIPTSSKPILSSGNGSSSVIPIAAGLTAASAAGLGAKAYIDRKRRKEEEEEEEEYEDDELVADEWTDESAETLDGEQELDAPEYINQDKEGDDEYYHASESGATIRTDEELEEF